MSLYDTISKEIQSAMKAREKVRLEALRGIKKEFIEAKTAPGAGGELTDADAVRILTRMAKQRRDSAKIYTEAGRPELAGNELAEAAVIEEFMPRQLSDDELRAALTHIIEETGAASPRDMGKVMGRASKELAGQAAGARISAMVRQLLDR